jgi:formylglycine-generating enzyme required for sulfatase activity
VTQRTAPFVALCWLLTVTPACRRHESPGGASSATRQAAAPPSSSAQLGGGVVQAPHVSMARIEGGQYLVGTPGVVVHPVVGLPRHLVRVATFHLDVTEATVGAYRACVLAGACTDAGLDEPGCNWTEPTRTEHPINCVTFEQAASYCRWVGKRLPTDEEWEVALRQDLTAAGGIDGFAQERACVTAESTAHCRPIDERASAGTCVAGSHPFEESRLGLQDLIGSVSEWTVGTFCPWKRPWCGSNVVRGTGWCANVYDELAQRRVSPRAGAPQAVTAPHALIGFRCASAPS